jgi:hypothetical protein
VVEDDYEPPFGHAELLSLKVFCKKMDIDLEKAVAELKNQVIEIGSIDESLEDISKRNNISPMDMYMIIKKFETPEIYDETKIYTPEMIDLEFSGTGIGNRSLQGICENIGIDIQVAKERLAQNNIEAENDETLKKIAEQLDLNPIDLLKVILIDGYKIE